MGTDTRTINTDGTKGPWQKVEEPVVAQTGPASRQLYLVRLRQTEGEPYHWCLTTCDAVNGDFYGNVYQVKGDAQDMEYQPNVVRIHHCSLVCLSRWQTWPFANLGYTFAGRACQHHEF